MEPNPYFEQPKQSRKKWIIIGAIGGVVLLAAIAAVVFFLLPKNSSKDQAAQSEAQIPNDIVIASSATPVSYAGHKVYDACNFISLDTIRKVVPGYQPLLDTIGTDKQPTEPLVIEHNYIDRDIASPLGKDGQPRLKGTTIGGSGKTTADNFISRADTNCWYGQGEDIAMGGSGKTFAKLFVYQPPTPISQEFQSYIGGLTKTASESGIDAYAMSELDESKFATVLFVDSAKSTIVMLKTGTKELIEPMSNDIIKVLKDTPKGPMTVIYPEPWSKLKDPCTLLTAADFQAFTGKPASAITEDSTTITELDGQLMQRRCARLEVERLNAGEISESAVTVRVAKDEKGAKGYIDHLRNDDMDNINIEQVKQPIDGVDDMYVRATGLIKVRAYELDLRIGAAIVTVNVEGESGLDASVDAYVERMLPIAQSVVNNWKK